MKKNNFNKGLLLTSLGSFWWGFIGVLYFKYVSFIGHVELVVHRCLWTAVMLIFTTTLFSKWKIFFEIIKRKKNLIALFISGLLIFINWSVWIYAISVNQLVEASFGYYIFPILSVFFGIIFLKETYNRNKIISVSLVIISLFYLLFQLKAVPWIGIIVAITFSLYGLIRKKIDVSSDIGLLTETLLMTPFALVLFFYLATKNINIFSFNEPTLSFYLFWSGLMTLIPLFWYTKGFDLIGIGPASMIFFLTPTAQFLLGYFYFNEPLDIHKLISFIFIWIAVSIYLNELRKE